MKKRIYFGIISVCIFFAVSCTDNRHYDNEERCNVVINDESNLIYSLYDLKKGEAWQRFEKWDEPYLIRTEEGLSNHIYNKRKRSNINWEEKSLIIMPLGSGQRIGTIKVDMIRTHNYNFKLSVEIYSTLLQAPDSEIIAFIVERIAQDEELFYSIEHFTLSYGVVE